MAGRAVVHHEGRLLLVTDEAGYWYTPGGRMETGETLPQCVAREVREETGLDVLVGDILAVTEFLDPATGEHKVECYFEATLAEPPGEGQHWHDTGGPVRSFGLFTAPELSSLTIQPPWLGDLTPNEDGEQPRRASIYLTPASGHPGDQP